MLINKMNKINSIPLKSNYINQECVSIQHEDNYALLKLLLPTKLIDKEQYKSVLKNKPQLVIDVINQYKYTTELAFSYTFNIGKSEQIIIKLYHDAQVAEILYCTDLQQFIRLLGPKICPKIHRETRSALNVFLNKWLSFLLKNSYQTNRWVKANL